MLDDIFHQQDQYHYGYGLDPNAPYGPYWDPAAFHGVGHPEQYSHCWQYQTEEDCAVMAQGEILESITGIHLTEQQPCQIT